MIQQSSLSAAHLHRQTTAAGKPPQFITGLQSSANLNSGGCHFSQAHRGHDLNAVDLAHLALVRRRKLTRRNTATSFLATDVYCQVLWKIQFKQEWMMEATSQIEGQKSTADLYSWWRAALEAPHLVGKPELPVHDEHPQCGYYKRRTIRNGPWEPAAIWEDADGSIMAMTGFEGREREQRASDLWNWVAKNPVSYEAYQAAFETGCWPDEGRREDDDAAPIGDNSRELTPQEQAEAAINDAIADAAVWLKRMGKSAPSTQDEANQGANIARRIADAAKDVAKLHTELKAPHLEAGRKIDNWKREVCDPAEKAKKELLAKVTAWQVAEQRRLDEERRKAEEAARAAAEAERQRLEAERLAQLAAHPEAPLDFEPIVVKAEAVPALRVKSGGATGRKASLRTFKVAVIKDYVSALAACADTDEVRSAVQAVATKRMRAGVAMPGVEVKEEQETRL